MLYKNREKKLSKDLFKNPTAEYRATPFWAWNGKIEETECVEQINTFKKMGFGGFHIHSRTGLDTEYLGKNFLDRVKTCVDEAKSQDMLVYLYDEDRWPSGFCGGKVTANKKYRQRWLLFTPYKKKENATFEDGIQTSGNALLATYSLNVFCGKLFGYKRITNKNHFGKKFYAYQCVATESDRFGKATYSDNLNKDAIDCFADLTYTPYKEKVGDEFGKTIPSIFTDEPQLKKEITFSPLCPIQAILPWTDSFAADYFKIYGEDILDYLPEIFFQSNKQNNSLVRYRYHALACEKFATAFSDNLGKRCENMGIYFTGHLMEEPTLDTQCRSVIECMRQYKNFGIPGIDLLCGRHEYNTAKQTQSVVRQEGKEGMLAELYGVSSWNADFGKFKEEGDWLACLGVTVRVPHLSLYQMKGEAKRDYPPSISYQAPWYDKFHLIEDHFARVNTVQTRGQAITEIGIIHPIESYWISMAADFKSSFLRKNLDRDFYNLSEWLLYNNLDFDYISESLLPSQINDNPLSVGKCKYKVIIVPNLITIRSTTIDFLKKFEKAGGKILYLGRKPAMVNGSDTQNISKELPKGIILPFTKKPIIDELEEYRLIDINIANKRCEDYISTLRNDNGLWLFLTAPDKEYKYPRSTPVINKNIQEKEIEIFVKGDWSASMWNTFNGDIIPQKTQKNGDFTSIKCKAYRNDSFLLRLDKSSQKIQAKEFVLGEKIDIPDKVDYRLDEPNVLLLDTAKWKISGKKFYNKRSDFLTITEKVRKTLGFGKYRSELQPWQRDKNQSKKKVLLRFDINNKSGITEMLFATEYDDYALFVNDKKIEVFPNGYYVDKSFKTTAITLKNGNNHIEIELPFGKYDRFENCYLLGNFGVKVVGNRATLIDLPNKIAFKDLTKQGLPFYGGKITYITSFVNDGSKIKINTRYSSALLDIKVNQDNQEILYAPFSTIIPTKKGNNSLEITAYVSRENCFGICHIRKKYKKSDSPKWFYKKSLIYASKNYILEKTGLLAKPEINQIIDK